MYTQSGEWTFGSTSSAISSYVEAVKSAVESVGYIISDNGHSQDDDKLEVYICAYGKPGVTNTAFFPTGYEDKKVLAWYSNSQTSYDSETQTTSLYLFSDESFITTKYKTGTSVEKTVETEGTYALTTTDDFENNSGTATLSDSKAYTFTLKNGVFILQMPEGSEEPIQCFAKRSDDVPEATEAGSGDNTKTDDDIKVTAVTITGEKSVEVGKTLTLTADVVPENATYSGITWTSSDTTIATVSDTGVVTAVAAGSVTITAQAGDVKGEYIITVEASVPSTKIALYQYDSTSGNYTYYLVDANEVFNDLSSLASNATSNSGSFCFDNDGNFYHHNINDYSSSTIQETAILPSGGVTIEDVVLDKILVDQKTNVMYGAKINEMTLTLYKYPSLISKQTVDDSVSYEINFNDPESFYHSQLAIYDGVLYDVGSVAGRETTYKLAIVTLPETPPTSMISSAKTVDLGLSDLNAKSPSLTDILYQDGAVYVLVRDYSSSVWSENLYSRGVLFKVDVSSDTNTVIKLGWTDENSATTTSDIYGYYYDYANGSATYYPWYAGNSDNASRLVLTNSNASVGLYSPLGGGETTTAGFFGPQKFVAICSNKLLIADEGILFENDNSDSAYTYKNVNRIVSVDLAKFAIDTVTKSKATFSTDSSDTLYSASALVSNYSSEVTIYYKTDDGYEQLDGSSPSIFGGIPLSE